MTYKLINNLASTNNHSSRLKELFLASDTVILTSPFLMSDFADFFSEIDLSQLKKLHLITKLCPRSFDQIKKITSLVSLIEFPDIRDKKIGCQISLNNKLHGKIYIFKKANNYVSAIISSANFTGSGLSRNHEWGVEISDDNEIRQLEQSILDSIEFSNLKFEEIYKMQKAANDFLDSQPQAEKRDIDLSLTSLLALESLPFLSDRDVEFWLKPIGSSEDPIKETRFFKKIQDKVHFSKIRPTGVKPNHILIAYGVGTTKMLSVYKVTSYPMQVPQNDINKDNLLGRYPWYVEAENLTSNFGATWPKHNLSTKFLLHEYLSLNPNQPITAVGGQTLGALNYRKDKLKLAPDFAKFIIKKIITIDSRL